MVWIINRVIRVRRIRYTIDWKEVENNVKDL